VAWENWIALDMILAKKQGRKEYASWLKANAALFSPNNTTPEGTITKAFQDLTTWTNKMVKKFGNRWPFHQLNKTIVKKKIEKSDDLHADLSFCSRSNDLGQMLFIPCLWGLTLRLIETALTKQTPVSYQFVVEYS
jgi:hypothetical protein